MNQNKLKFSKHEIDLVLFCDFLLLLGIAVVFLVAAIFLLGKGYFGALESWFVWVIVGLLFSLFPLAILFRRFLRRSHRITLTIAVVCCAVSNVVIFPSIRDSNPRRPTRQQENDLVYLVENSVDRWISQNPIFYLSSREHLKGKNVVCFADSGLKRWYIKHISGVRDFLVRAYPHILTDEASQAFVLRPHLKFTTRKDGYAYYLVLHSARDSTYYVFEGRRGLFLVPGSLRPNDGS